MSKTVLSVSAVIVAVVFWKNRRAALAAFLIVSFLVGAWRIEVALNGIPPLNEQSELFRETGMVVRESQANENYQKLIVESDDKRILINTNLFTKYEYGEEIEISCELQTPKNRNEFDYRMYLAKDGIYYICQKAQIEKTGINHGNLFYSWIIKLKNTFRKNIESAIPFPESAFGTGILLGANSELSREIQENFSKTGMSHVVAVSGYNVTMIAEYLIWLGILLGLWRKQALIFAWIGIFIFVVMIGFPSSAVRAGFMSGLIIWAMRSGRLGDSFRSVMIAAFIMLAINPLVLRYDIGFQLSFLATLGIVEFGTILQERLIKKQRAMGMSEIVMLSILAQVFVLPVIMYNFKIVSLVSVLANVAVLPFIPIAMLFTFLSGLLGFFSILLAKLFAWPAYFILFYQIKVIEIFANLRWSSLKLDQVSISWVLSWYFLLVALLVLKNKSKIKSYLDEL